MDERSALTRRSLAVALVWGGAFVAFFWIHRGLSITGNTYIQDAAGTTHLDQAAVRLDLQLDTLRFLAASIAMIALILGARRLVLFALPIVMTVLLPAVFGGVPDCFAFDQSRVPHGIGAGWSYTTFVEGCGYRFFATWWGVAVDLFLVLLPAVTLVLVARPTRAVSSRRPVRPGSQLVAVAASLTAVIVLMSIRELLFHGVDWFVWLGIHIPLVTFGAMLGLRRSWWSLALVAVPIGLFPLEATVLVGSDLREAAYLVAITALAAAWMPLAAIIEAGRGSLARFSRREVAVPVGS